MAGRAPRPKVSISSSQRTAPVPRKGLADLTRFVSDAEGVRIAEIDIAIVSARKMAALNRRYLGHAGPTDVLSFDLSEAPGAGLVGHVVVCGDVAAAEAAARGLPIRHELMLYVVHGLLHLMGYDDRSVHSAARMHARQEELLREFAALRPGSARPPRGPRGRKERRTHG